MTGVMSHENALSTKTSYNPIHERLEALTKHSQNATVSVSHLMR